MSAFSVAEGVAAGSWSCHNPLRASLGFLLGSQELSCLPGEEKRRSLGERYWEGLRAKI